MSVIKMKALTVLKTQEIFSRYTVNLGSSLMRRDDCHLKETFFSFTELTTDTFQQFVLCMLIVSVIIAALGHYSRSALLGRSNSCFAITYLHMLNRSFNDISY